MKKTAVVLFIAAVAAFFPSLNAQDNGGGDFTDAQYEKADKVKESFLEKQFGKMRNLVGHAVIPFDAGGNVDMYYFDATPGTIMATMELIRPDGTGPAPSRIGTYELVAYTREKYSEKRDTKFGRIERRMCGIFTTLGNYGAEEVLNPLDTCEIPQEKGDAICLIFDQAGKTGGSFSIGGKKCGLLLVIEVFRSEMEFAMRSGTGQLVKLLKEKGYYPYSDLDRPKVR